jgi:hypothetical protein
MAGIALRSSGKPDAPVRRQTPYSQAAGLNAGVRSKNLAKRLQGPAAIHLAQEIAHVERPFLRHSHDFALCFD